MSEGEEIPKEVESSEIKPAEIVDKQPSSEPPLSPEELEEAKQLEEQMKAERAKQLKNQLDMMMGKPSSENQSAPEVQPTPQRTSPLKLLATKLIGGLKRIINIATLGIVFKQQPKAV